MNEPKNKKTGLKNYWPLLAMILVAVLAACAINSGIDGDSLYWMHYFMGFLLCQFALVKLFDISGFADGFQMYDLIAKKSRYYALIYPFIELSLGLLFLSLAYPLATYLVTLFFLTIGVIGVIKALKKGLDIYCPCMGSILKVPLSTVTLIEDLGMGLMALLMLITRYL